MTDRRPERIVVVVPCGRSKFLDRDTDVGPVTSAAAYTGTPFRFNRQYAQRFCDAWVVLSAKCGFIAPDFIVPEPYEVSFKHRATGPISLDRLRQQVREQQLDPFSIIVDLWNKRLRDRAPLGTPGNARYRVKS